MRAWTEAHSRRARRRAFAVDGARIEAPHTAANGAELGRAGRGKAAPQVFPTAPRHMGPGLPRGYRVGPGTDGERTRMERMVKAPPPRSLPVADAGPVGPVGPGPRPRLLRQGRSFLLRVGGGIAPLEAPGYYHEGRGGPVYPWPREHRHTRPPVLRPIALRHGKQGVYPLTGVPDPKRPDDAGAAEPFGMGRGEEVLFRSYKQALGRRRLLSRTAATCLIEARWTPGVVAVGPLDGVAAVISGIDPPRLSVAEARDAVRRALRDGRPRRGPRSPEAAPRAAVEGGYRREGSKAARNYPRKKREKPPGPPEIQTATEAEVRKARKLPPPEIPLRWAA